ncbi:MAG: RsmB/NOP family class I SAM-dependent RNA methyltransferase [Planctomycetota bacterium]|nr:MAG: RsmB/NOP family class I SAM-dependent RNA methyltransferase [Planctomycetota bacterium]
MGQSEFDACYRELFGDRWPELRAALTAPRRFGARANPFEPTGAAALRSLPGAREIAGLKDCFESESPFEPPERGPAGLLGAYLLDAASVVAAEALGVQAGEDVLDLCAAPGGKALVLARACADGGSLTANDRSAARRARLARVLDDHLPPGVRERVRVTGHDATRWSLHERDAYDRILLDAPCSSEQHVLADPRALREWSPARSRQLARRQYAMLASALDVVRVGGCIVYATCALAPAENDGIIARLLADGRRAGRARALEPSGPFGEATEHGWAILPDRTGWGPMWFARTSG